jgi:hypothetical protein
LLAVVLTGWTVVALAQGKINIGDRWGPSMWIVKNSDPLKFWFYVGMIGLGAVATLVHVVVRLFN